MLKNLAESVFIWLSQLRQSTYFVTVIPFYHRKQCQNYDLLRSWKLHMRLQSVRLNITLKSHCNSYSRWKLVGTTAVIAKYIWNLYQIKNGTVSLYIINPYDLARCEYWSGKHTDCRYFINSYCTPFITDISSRDKIWSRLNLHEPFMLGRTYILESDSSGGFSNLLVISCCFWDWLRS